MNNIELKNTVQLTKEELQQTNGGILPLIAHGTFILFQAGMAAGIYEMEKKYKK